jgi:hypothetical protein
MTQANAPVVRRQVVVNAPQAKAFETFTGRFGDFKPPEHNLLGVPIAETVFEPRVGGHIYDRATRYRAWSAWASLRQSSSPVSRISCVLSLSTAPP